MLFSDLPELIEILPVKSLNDSTDEQKQQSQLKQVFQCLMTSDKEAVSLSLKKLLSRLESSSKYIFYYMWLHTENLLGQT